MVGKPRALEAPGTRRGTPPDMSHDGHKSNAEGAVPPPLQTSGAPKASRQSDKGLVALLASAPGTSVRALQDQFLLCIVLGVLLLEVPLSLAIDAHSRARVHSPSVPLLFSLVQGRMGASGAEGRAGSHAHFPASDSGSDSGSESDSGSDSGLEKAWDSETRAGFETGEERGKGAEAGAGSDSGTGAEAGAGAGQGRKSPRLGMRGARGRDRRSRGWPRTSAKGQGAMSLLFGRQRQQGSAKGHTRGTLGAGALPWYTKNPRGRALGRHDAGDRAAGALPWYTKNPRGRALGRHDAGDRAARAVRVQVATRKMTLAAEKHEPQRNMTLAAEKHEPQRNMTLAAEEHEPQRNMTLAAEKHEPQRNMTLAAAGPQRSLPPWVPHPGKYFLGYCQLYGWTNRLICMEQALVLAVLLNRTLLLPQRNVCDSSPKPQNSDHMLVDVKHLRECLAQGILSNKSTSVSSASSAAGDGSLLQGGLAVGARGESRQRQEELVRQQLAVHGLLASYGVVTLHEYQKALGVRTVTADVLFCDFSKCPSKHCNSLGRLQFANSIRPPLQLYWPAHFLTEEDLEVLRNVTAHANVLSFGDLFRTSVRGYQIPLKTSLGPLLGTSCPLPVRPHQGIFQLAEDFTKKHFEGPYAAVHLRRDDFKKYLGDHKRPYWSIPQAADCVASEMTKLGLSLLFMATDATRPEREWLQALLGARNITLRLHRPGWHQESLTQALVDKVMCARAQVFLYQPLSTFSWHILQLREGLGHNSSYDKPLCAGRKSNFLPHTV